MTFSKFKWDLPNQKVQNKPRSCRVAQFDTHPPTSASALDTLLFAYFKPSEKKYPNILIQFLFCYGQFQFIKIKIQHQKMSVRINKYLIGRRITAIKNSEEFRVQILFHNSGWINEMQV